jgi:putative restriction endonuclease
VGREAARVRWWAANGPDEVSNALALCSLHHKLFDRCAIGLTPNHATTVSAHFNGRSPASDDFVLSLVDRPLLTPQVEQHKPHPDQIAWYGNEVLRAPARQAAM